jgi:hypothetical protein
LFYSIVAARSLQFVVDKIKTFPLLSSRAMHIVQQVDGDGNPNLSSSYVGTEEPPAVDQLAQDPEKDGQAEFREERLFVQVSKFAKGLPGPVGTEQWPASEHRQHRAGADTTNNVSSEHVCAMNKVNSEQKMKINVDLTLGLGRL